MKSDRTDILLIIRGLLAISVVVWHIASGNQSTPGMIYVPGRTAVWFFFGISGYVISYGFMTGHYRFQKKDILRFYFNRVVRIYPLFLLLSLLTLVTIYLVNGRWLLGIKEVPAQLLMLQYNHEYVLSGVFWTLGIEVQFYLVAPFFARLFERKGSYLIAGILYILLVLWMPVSYYLFGTGFDGRNLPANLSHFIIGMIGCKIIIDRREPNINSAVLTLLIAMVILTTNALYAYAIRYYWTLGSMLIDVAILLSILLYAGFKEERKANKNVSIRFLSLLGLISYGIYAWHPYLIQFVPYLKGSILLSIIVTVIVAYFSYRVIEAPILRLKSYKTNTRGGDHA